MRYLDERYAKVLTYDEFDICTLKVAIPSQGDSLGYVVDHEAFGNEVFNHPEDAIKAIDNYQMLITENEERSEFLLDEDMEID